MLGFILGIVIVVAIVASLIFSFSQTPDNLTGFYGVFYFLIAIGGLVGGVYLILGYLL